MTQEEKNSQLNEIYSQIGTLKAQLESSDYKIIKCAEDKARGVSKANLPYDIDALHEERQAIRDQINALEAQRDALIEVVPEDEEPMESVEEVQ